MKKVWLTEDAKGWITESSSRALTTYKHKLDIALNEDAEKREGEITFKSGDKVETVKVYQAGGALILLSQNEYTVNDTGETISVDIKSNVEYGVQMPDVDWITDEASSRGMSSHTLKYVIVPNEGYDSRSAEIIFYDKNSDLKETLKVVQAQKDAIVISQKTYNVKAEGETFEVKLSANVNFEVTMPEVDWITQTESRALTEHTFYFLVKENTSDESRSAEIVFSNKDSQIDEKIIINQNTKGSYSDGIVNMAKSGTMKELLGDNYMDIVSLKIVGPINGDDLYYLHKMSHWNGGGKLTTLDLAEASIVEGGNRYNSYYATKDEIPDGLFEACILRNIVLPHGITSIGERAIRGCPITSIIIPDQVVSIGGEAFASCKNLTSIIYGKKVNYIGKWAFAGCRSLASVSIGDGDMTIDEYAFSKCKSLTSVTIGKGSVSIGIGSFAQNSALTSVTIKGNASIDSEAFYGCGALTSITFSENLVSIGELAFYACGALRSLTIPSGIIEKRAFTQCESLTSVIFGDGVTYIQDGAFRNCSSLKTITLGKNVKGLNVATFKYTSISECYCYATTPPDLTDTTFDLNWVREAILYVPNGYGNVYKKSYWGRIFGKIVEMKK